MTSVRERTAERRKTFVRMWRILVLLRQRPHTLQELAQMLGTSSRTIRRDVYALKSVPLPIESRFPTGSNQVRQGVRACEQNEWFLTGVTAWPRREIAPVAEVGAATPLPPFPQGPLLPRGWHP